MPERGIISTNQFIWMLFLIITSVTAMQIPRVLIVVAGRDSLLSVLGGWFMDVLLAIVYAYMGIRFQGQNFVQYSITILGEYAGRVVGIVFTLFFLLASATLQRGLSQLINIAFMQNTPPEVILLVSYALIAYGARIGIEGIARVSEILGPIYIISVIFVGILLTPYADIARFKPQFEHGVYPFLTGSALILTYYGICIMMAMFIPLCNRPENGFLAKFSAVSMGALFVGVIVGFAIAVFGFEQASSMYAPGLELARLISLGSLLERVEIIWMMGSIAVGIIVSAILIWAFSLGVSQVLGLYTYKPLAFPAAILSLMLSLTSFDNVADYISFTKYTYPIIAFFVEAGLEIFLFAFALLLRKRVR